MLDVLIERTLLWWLFVVTKPCAALPAAVPAEESSQ